MDAGLRGEQTGVAVVDDVEDGRPAHRGLVPAGLAAGIPVGGVPDGAGDIQHVHRVGAQVLGPQPLHLVAQIGVDAGHAQHGADHLGAVGPVYVCQAQDHQV